MGHKSPISESSLIVLQKAGVKYISTRNIGTDHIDLDAARRMGIAVGNVTYSPDGVADYTLMLILMAIRNAKSIVTGAIKNDFRLNAARGKGLRDMTVGKVLKTPFLPSPQTSRQRNGQRYKKRQNPFIVCSDAEGLPVWICFKKVTGTWGYDTEAEDNHVEIYIYKKLDSSSFRTKLAPSVDKENGRSFGVAHFLLCGF